MRGAGTPCAPGTFPSLAGGTGQLWLEPPTIALLLGRLGWAQKIWEILWEKALL